MLGPITYLATHFPAISHTFIATEVNALRAIGVAVVPVSLNTVATPDAGTAYLKSLPKWRVLIRVAIALVLHPSLLTIPWHAREGAGPRAILWRHFQLAEAIVLYRLMCRAGSSHVHAHFGQAPATVAWYATEVARRHRRGRANTWSFTVHGWHEFSDEQHTRLRAKAAAATTVICVSDFTRAQLYRQAAFEDWHKIHVVRCGIDHKLFPVRSAEPAHTQPRIAIVGRVAPEKGHLVLVDAVALLHARGFHVSVDVVGPDDQWGDVVRHHADDVGVADAFNWLGALPPGDVARVLGETNVFCLPTFAEGLPVVIMEAMACGVPVVTTYISGIPELAVDRQTAMVVPAARADLLADAVMEVLTDDALRQRITEAALIAVRERHDIEQNVRVLAQLLASHTREDSQWPQATIRARDDCP